MDLETLKAVAQALVKQIKKSSDFESVELFVDDIVPGKPLPIGFEYEVDGEWEAFALDITTA